MKNKSCCPWLRPQKLSVSVVVPPAPVRVPRQRPLAPSVTSAMSVANDKGDNDMILGAVYRSPGICLTVEENPRKPRLGDRLMNDLWEQTSLQIGFIPFKRGR